MREMREQKEFHLMTNLLKTAIKQDREFTIDEAKKFKDLFENIAYDEIMCKSEA